LPSGCASYAMLVERWRQSQVPREISFHFLNATSFRSDKRTWPLPEPRLVFGSLMNRWQAFTNCRLRDLPDDSLMAFASHHIDILEYKIEAQAYGYKGEAETGFRGEVLYHFNRKSEYLAEKWPELEKRIQRDYIWYLRWMGLLADFAAYSGVGRKTTTGMGLTRVSKWG
jgi:CRISPR-associated endoribonuclease Cas6